MDLRHIDRNVLKAYPWFFNRLMDNGVDPNKELVEVGPMAHSFSGGIMVDGNYESTVAGFYAVGEACGGVHGEMCIRDRPLTRQDLESPMS